MSLESVLLKLFGVRTYAEENPLISSLGTTAAKILPNDPDRLAYLVINLSSNVVYVALKSDVASTKGARLDANGGSYGMVFNEDFQMTGWELWGVATGASSAIYVLAVREYQHA